MAFSFLAKFQKKHTLPSPGADGYNLQLFQYFPQYPVTGLGFANQGQFRSTAFSPPVTLGAHVISDDMAVVGGVGGLQNGGYGMTPLYNPQTGVTGRNGI